MCPFHHPQGRGWEYNGGCVQPKKLQQDTDPVSCSFSMSEKYLHPCSSSRSSWVHCLDVARSSPSNHKPPAHCIPHNLQGKQQGFKNQVMGWREEMQQFLERHRAHHPNLLWVGEKGPCSRRGAELINCSLQSCFLIDSLCRKDSQAASS